MFILISLICYVTDLQNGYSPCFNVLKKKKTNGISVIFNLNSIFSLYSEQLGQITEIHTKNKENEGKE